MDCGVLLSRSPQGSGGKSALLEQIRGGTQLKKVEPPASKPPATTIGRDALLNQIRQGIQLKNVSATVCLSVFECISMFVCVCD